MNNMLPSVKKAIDEKEALVERSEKRKIELDE
jgi:hypothetical protein